MKAPCRSILGALVFLKCGFLDSLWVAAHIECVRARVHANIITCSETCQCALHRSFIYCNTLTPPHVQAPQCSKNCNHRQETDAGLGCYCFPYRPQQHIYFSRALSSHFIAEKTIHWLKSPAGLLFIHCPQSWIICFGIKVRKANKSKQLLMLHNSKNRNEFILILKILYFFFFLFLFPVFIAASRFGWLILIFHLWIENVHTFAEANRNPSVLPLEHLL